LDLYGRRALQEKEKTRNAFFTYHGQTYSFFPNRFSSVRDAVTLPAIGSYHDPITCQVTAKMDCRMIQYWPFWALTGLVRAQHGHRSFLFFRTASRPFAAPILCIWSDTITIQPHAKYRRLGYLVRPQLPGSAQNDKTFLYSFFSERLPGRSRRRYFACGWIMSSDPMKSYSRNGPSDGEILAILCAPSCLGAHKMIKRRF
jgi:hypothetical protein